MKDIKEFTNKPYTKHFHCSNCGMEFDHEFEFGEVAHQPPCPNCGVSNSDLFKPTL